MTNPRHISAILPEAFRLITARFTSTASCGHLVIEGEKIGYNATAKKTRCSKCMAAKARERQCAVNERMKVG